MGTTLKNWALYCIIFYNEILLNLDQIFNWLFNLVKNYNIKNLKFNLFPNPANSILNIDLATELKSVEIYSLQGQKVLSATEKQINISGLSSGIYIVKVIDKNSAVATQKLVKN